MVCVSKKRLFCSLEPMSKMKKEKNGHKNGKLFFQYSKMAIAQTKALLVSNEIKKPLLHMMLLEGEIHKILQKP